MTFQAKNIRFLIITLILICFTKETYSQNGSQKTILYEQYNYSANGYLDKNKFIENQNLTFRTERLIDFERILRDTILNGRYFSSEDGNSYIDGIWKNNNQDLTKIVRVSGVFRISNNENGIGINSNKNKGIELTINTLPNKQYYVNIINSFLSLESNIHQLEVQELYSEIFNEHILNSENVKLSFKNGDVFTGTVKADIKVDRYDYIPVKGEYKYATGEVFNGEIYYSDVFYKFLPYQGIIVFTDGTIDNGNWLSKLNLSYKEQEDLFRESKSLTELRNRVKKSSEEKEKKILTEKITQENKNQEIIQNNRIIQKKLKIKYGDYWGNIIYKKEYTPGMTKEMLLEFTNDKYYKISKMIRNGNSIEIWEFDKQKMMLEILKSGNEKEATSLLVFTEFENLGLVDNLESGFPTLVFSNGQLTDVYQK